MADNTMSLAELVEQRKAALVKMAELGGPSSPADRPRWWRANAAGDREIADIYTAIADAIQYTTELDALGVDVVSAIVMAFREAAKDRRREADNDDRCAAEAEEALRAAGSAGA